MFIDKCPICKKLFTHNGKESLEDSNRSTIDCPKCNGLLLIEKGTIVGFTNSLDNNTKTKKQ